MKTASRRKFISNIGKGVGIVSLTPSLSLLSNASCASPKNGKVGIALVGLGNYSRGQLGPALKETKLAYLSGIVTGTPAKADTWSREYNIPEKNIYNYENYDEIAENKDIDVIYIVLPNSMHAEYTIRALKAGKDVICETPMAMNAAEGEEMIRVAKEMGKRLSVGYRMHYDPYYIEMKRLGLEKAYGEITYQECGLAYRFTWEPGNWHMKKSMGGGALYNLGVYPIQGARNTKGMEPVAVHAQAITARPEHFPEVPETFTWQMEYPDKSIANCHTSSAVRLDRLFCGADKGNFELTSAYGYSGQAGYSPKGTFDFPQVNQQALQMDDFARCLLEDDDSIVSADKHIMDLYIIDAIHKSIEENGRRVEIKKKS